MESLEEAQAIYEETAKSGECSVDTLAGKVEHQADDALEEVAHHLIKTAKDLRGALRKYNPTMKRLEDDTAGQAELNSSSMWIDPEKIIANNGADVIDSDLAEDIGRHEKEHQQQFAISDAHEIQIGSTTYDERKIREAAAISVMKSREELSDEYKAIASLTMDKEDRDLVRKGRFLDLERKKNGNQVSNAA